MRLHLAETIQNKNTTDFPREMTINTLDSLRLAASFDHMAAAMKDNKRKKVNFLETDCIIADLDNDHSDDPSDWKTVGDVCDAFPEVPFYVVRSRNYMKPKDGKEPREKFHFYFPLSKPITTKEEFDKTMGKLLAVFPYFDSNAKDCARLIYGVKDPHVEEF